MRVIGELRHLEYLSFGIGRSMSPRMVVASAEWLEPLSALPNLSGLTIHLGGGSIVNYLAICAAQVRALPALTYLASAVALSHAATVEGSEDSRRSVQYMMME
jgi:hypothetical protein